MGVKIVKADIVSMNMPTNKTKRFISSKIKNGLSAMPRNAEVTISGKCSNVRTLVKNEATAIIIKILLTVLYVPTIAFFKMEKENLPLIASTINM